MPAILENNIIPLEAFYSGERNREMDFAIIYLRNNIEVLPNWLLIKIANLFDFQNNNELDTELDRRYEEIKEELEKV